MDHISVDFARQAGRMKPLHSVNNGPVYKTAPDQRITNLPAFQAAGIPYVRTHDASFYATYGGEHTVDVHMIFPDFSRDPADPAAYDFTLTDEYLRVIALGGSRVFYRLGSKIEHEIKKYGTLPPPDFHKWARICEHIIRHYTQGWADGFHYDMAYWEIWNEPDGFADDAPPEKKTCWGGTQAQFCQLFDITARHLKACFPDKKIGGPAVCYPLTDWARRFLDYLRSHQTPLDFFSWHMYSADPWRMAQVERETRELLDAYGFTAAESILNEWNYVRGWEGEEWIYSLTAERGLKGSAFIAAALCLSQYAPLDLLMYYDARPCAMNGLFAPYEVNRNLKGYYALYFFNQLYRLGNAAAVSGPEKGIAVCAAENGARKAVLLTHYADDDGAAPRQVKLSLAHLQETEQPLRLTYYLLDETHDGAPYREEIVTGIAAAAYLTLPLFTSCLLTIEPAAPEA